MHELQKKIIGIYQIVLFIIFSEYTSFSLDTQNFYYALYKKIIDFRHAEFISASLRLKEVLKQVQHDKVISVFFINILCQCFLLKEPDNFIFVSGGQFCAHIKTFFQVCRKLFFSVLFFLRFTEP